MILNRAQGVSQEMTEFPVKWDQRDRKVTRVPRVPKTPPPPHQDPAENQDPPVKSVCPENQDPEGTLVTPGPLGSVEFRYTIRYTDINRYTSHHYMAENTATMAKNSNSLSISHI